MGKTLKCLREVHNTHFLADISERKVAYVKLGKT